MHAEVCPGPAAVCCAGDMQAVKLSRELTRQGFSHTEIARLCRSGELSRIRSGAYLAGPDLPADDRDRHRCLIEATVRLSAPESVLSHASAAVLLGLPIWSDTLDRVHLTRDRANGARTKSFVQVHSGSLHAEDVTEVAGLPVTSLARTVVDLGRALPLMRSVAVADAALGRGLSAEALQRTLARAATRKGVGAARRMSTCCDGRSESVGESTSRIVLAQAGVPPSSLQYEVRDEAGHLVGRTDFCWEAYRTLGEFDGRIKYGRLLRPGQDTSDVVYAEKLREDRLRDLGWQVVRWTWDDLARPHALGERLRRAFARGTVGQPPAVA